jgi:DNA-binding MarR family transcriptional regulator
MSATKKGESRQLPSGDQIVLGMLNVVDRDPSITQRTVANELGIALGLVNSYLKRCVRKGLIKVYEAPTRRYAYYLTPQGFAEKSRLTASYLRHSFSMFHQARVQFSELFTEAVTRGQKRVALIGAGDLADIASLVAREYPVETAGVVAGGSDAKQLMREARALGRIDAVVVTAMADSRETFEAAVEAFGADRVHVPDLLRVRSSGSAKPAKAKEVRAQ